MRNNIHRLILQSGIDIPFPQGGVTIHQPKLIEIAYIGGDEVLLSGCELLKFSKEILNDEDKTHLEPYSDFHILMSVINDNNESTQSNVSNALKVLQIMFPTYNIHVSLETMEIQFLNDEQTIIGKLNNNNYSDFKEILKTIFCLTNKDSATEKYDPQGELAKRIADKFKKREQQLAKLKPKQTLQTIDIYSKYVSILTVGERKDMNQLMQLTVYQLLDEFQRYELKEENDFYFKAQLAGAKDLKAPESWKKNLYEQGRT